jgi:hypothetical protein
LQSDYKAIAMRLRGDCKAISKPLQSKSWKVIAKRLRLLSDCKAIVKIMQSNDKLLQSHRNTIVKPLRSHCTTIAHRLESIAQRLRNYCKAIAIPILVPNDCESIAQ